MWLPPVCDRDRLRALRRRSGRQALRTSRLTREILDGLREIYPFVSSFDELIALLALAELRRMDPSWIPPVPKRDPNFLIRVATWLIAR